MAESPNSELHTLVQCTMQEQGLTLPGAMVYLTSHVRPEDLFATHAHFEDFRRIEALDIQKVNMAFFSQSISKVYKCSKCGSNRISVRNVQMRSGDEGQTEIRHCLQCGTVAHVNS